MTSRRSTRDRKKINYNHLEDDLSDKDCENDDDGDDFEDLTPPVKKVKKSVEKKATPCNKKNTDKTKVLSDHGSIHDAGGISIPDSNKIKTPTIKSVPRLPPEHCSPTEGSKCILLDRDKAEVAESSPESLHEKHSPQTPSNCKSQGSAHMPCNKSTTVTSVPSDDVRLPTATNKMAQSISLRSPGHLRLGLSRNVRNIKPLHPKPT